MNEKIALNRAEDMFALLPQRPQGTHAVVESARTPAGAAGQEEGKAIDDGTVALIIGGASVLALIGIAAFVRSLWHDIKGISGPHNW